MGKPGLRTLFFKVIRNFDLVSNDSMEDISLLKKRVEIIYSTMSLNIMGNVLTGGILLIYLWDAVPQAQALTWYSSLLLICLIRFFSARKFEREVKAYRNSLLWGLLYLIFAFSCGALWGSVGVIYFSTKSPLQLELICFMIGGMCVAGSASMAVIKEIAYVYILTSITPITFQFFSVGNNYEAMGTLCVLFMMICFNNVNQSNRSMSEALRLETENSKLLEFYKTEREKAEELNQELKKEIKLKQITQNELFDLAQVAESAKKTKYTLSSNLNRTISEPIKELINSSRILIEEEIDPVKVERLYNIQKILMSVQSATSEISDYTKILTQSLIISQQPTNIRDIALNSFHTILSQNSRKNLHRKFDINSTVPELILIDTKRMQQIITNLTSKVSEIALNDSSIELKIDRAIDATRDKLIFKLIVSRANPTHLGNSDIFDTFYEEDAQDKLGMAISASLIKLMKGDIKLEPFPDQSAVLLFWVPLVEYKEDQTPTKESLSILKTTSEPMKILVAEDNPINRKLTKTILEQEGHEVLTVVDGIEAIEAFKEGDFDLVLMDVQMPRLDGYEAAKIIKEGNKCEFPIIALSTHISPEEKEKQENAGMCDYISKPIKKESLIKIVEHYNHNCIARK